MNQNILIAKDIYKSFKQGDKDLQVLKGVNFEFKQGITYALTGVSGSGKSTLLHVLGGLDKPDNGEILFNNHNIYKIRQNKKEDLLNQELGFIFQFHYLIKELTVLENIILMGLIKGDSKKDCQKRALELIEYVGLQDKIHSYPTELSGGQQQRVSILRAIFNKPSFLLADEPTGDLDSQNALLIVDLLEQCRKLWGMGLIICTHDSSVFCKMDVVLKLHAGILEFGDKA